MQLLLLLRMRVLLLPLDLLLLLLDRLEMTGSRGQAIRRMHTLHLVVLRVRRRLTQRLLLDRLLSRTAVLRQRRILSSA